MSHTRASLSPVQVHTLEAVVKFEPITQQELKQLVPEHKPHEVEVAISELKNRGFVTIADEGNREFDRVLDEDTVIINTDPFKMPQDGQQSLTSAEPDRDAVIDSNLPDSVNTERTITLELTEEQTKRFEKMRADVSRNCGVMNKEEFVEWILREAGRMTEV